MVDLSLLGLTAALLAGVISFVSPCVLPLVPGYVSYIAGRTVTGPAAPSRRHVVWLSFCFVLGFSTIFIALGASATARTRPPGSFRSRIRRRAPQSA